MGAVLPDFGGYRRIVQSPGTVAIFYDTGQGQGWQRVIPVDGPASAASIRQRFGDSRGHWEGNTLVVDVTNFSPKFNFLAAQRKPPSRRALDTHRRQHDPLRGHHRGPDDVDDFVEG